jgi:hypothetical protein
VPEISLDLIDEDQILVAVALAEEDFHQSTFLTSLSRKVGMRGPVYLDFVKAVKRGLQGLLDKELLRAAQRTYTVPGSNRLHVRTTYSLTDLGREVYEALSGSFNSAETAG